MASTVWKNTFDLFVWIGIATRWLIMKALVSHIEK